MKDFEIDSYLARIQLNDCNNGLEDLITLQQYHMQHIPFENLDVVAGRAIDLDYEHLFNKIISSKRGGYCFELNLLYSKLLKALGFSPIPILGRVWLRDPEKTPPRNHLAHLVTLENELFITDVGFGGVTTRVPLPINSTSDVNDRDGFVRIVPFENHQYMLQRKIGHTWVNQYSFENVKISEEDIQIANYYMSTNPKSHFYHNNFIGKFTKNGRIGLFNTQMSTRQGLDIVEKKEIPYGEEWIETLKNDFNLMANFSEKELERLFGKK